MTYYPPYSQKSKTQYRFCDKHDIVDVTDVFDILVNCYGFKRRDAEMVIFAFTNHGFSIVFDRKYYGDENYGIE